jgi:hypothetical protein
MQHRNWSIEFMFMRFWLFRSCVFVFVSISAPECSCLLDPAFMHGCVKAVFH